MAITFAASLLLAGCSNPASDDDDDHNHEEHPVPHSVEFVMNNETIVTYDNEVSGHFDVEEQNETASITAEFFDEEGHEIHSEDLSDEYFLDWQIANTDHADIEQDDSEGRWSFHIVGKSADKTTVQFLMKHVDHEVYNTPAVDGSNPIEIHVAEPSN